MSAFRKTIELKGEYAEAAKKIEKEAFEDSKDQLVYLLDYGLLMHLAGEYKESNRALTLQEEFGKMGIEIILQDDLMLIKGGTGLKGATVHSRHDHRIAMACAVAALKADGEVVIEEADAINKSYPDFYEHLEKLGASLKYTGIPVNH